MLTEVEIDMHMYKMHYYMIDTKNQTINTKQNSNLFLLLNNELRILGVSQHSKVIKSLSGFNSYWAKSFFTKTMTEHPEFEFKKNVSWMFTLNSNRTQWIKNLSFKNIEDLNLNILTNQKIAALDIVYNYIASAYSQNEQTSTQNFIYLSKYLEAKEILNKNIESDHTLEYPYITGYANQNNLTLQEAAKNVKLKYEMASGFFSEIENLRTKFQKSIIEESDIKNLKNHVDKFIVQFSKYGDL